MTTLHTFGCSITQGFALPDLIRPITDSQGRPLSLEQLEQRARYEGDLPRWEDIHINAASDFAWPQILAHRLAIPVHNSARRGACFQQIARQCAERASQIKPGDTVIVMWTYISRLSMQWPARSTVPMCNIVDPRRDWHTVILGFNKFFGLSRSDAHSDTDTKSWIEQHVRHSYLDPRGMYNHLYNNLVLAQMTAGLLCSTGARVIHLSVEPDPYLDQIEQSRQSLDPSLRDYSQTSDPQSWFTLDIDHTSCHVLHDPSIPPAENDMHPSVQHHSNFADLIYSLYFT